jgi:hypothetical protein
MEVTLEELYPNATAEQRDEAHRRLMAYLRVVLEIADDQHRARVDAARPDLYDGSGRALSAPNTKHGI